MKPAFDGLVALVTGASGGMGHTIAATLAHEGVRGVLLTGRNRDRLEEIADELSAVTDCRYVVTDLRQPASADTIADAVRSQFGQLDVIAANAGAFPSTPFERITEQELMDVIEVNLLSVFRLLQRTVPLLKRSEFPAITVTSSITGAVVGFPGLAHYGAAKAGLDGLVRSLAVELGTAGIRINAVSPGTVAGRDEVSGPRFDFASEHIPLGAMCTWQDVADAVAFFLSPRAAYITGQTLLLDGGQTLVER